MTSTSNNKFADLAKRLVTGILGAAFTIFVVAYDQWGFFGAFLFLAVMTQLEFYKLIQANGIIPLKTYGTLMGVLIFTLFFLGSSGHIYDTDWFYIILPLTSGVYFIKLYKKDEKKPFTNIAFTFLGIFYVALPISLLSVAAFSMGHYSYQIIIGLFLILWASDTGAYFAGIQFGKRKLFERVSPKKSWEGSVGGAILSMVFALGVSYYFHDLERWQWIVISLIIIVCGTYGDLIESLFKRSMQIKDSGRKLPGHGGFLDRFDGLLLSVPFIVIFLKFCMKY
ncbi:phosphatidate cytidylyltransferase [Reichenbachiella agariperforans]|uniref:Phosphatidate cytidylyltransferase n=1 Tax=Reichenbachiella agariperforans TaxID=156994 RepID=A0A1M6P3Q5_REIAG|nr:MULTISPECIES: phosphatidate cytidylyltransferase [Reichenbachiella]MBU2914681.1 phosphatidate cytidylyltransferase [Reichenbachiella agariperforans]RJE71604.1 phosphatidate cytidylyltransferase [Reichenbachiella sp. MSK19-1]SHK02607.1 phosphatidate cytidylyltransferase [Reichenbachiella agariperforans]